MPAPALPASTVPSSPHTTGMGIDHHRKLTVWQEAMDLVTETYRVVRLLPADERFDLASQTRRAAVSAPSNIAEGYGRCHRGDFVRQLSVARASVRELETQLDVAERVGYVDRGQLVWLLALAEDVDRMTTRLILRLCQ